MNERDIEIAILDWLNFQGVFAWQVSAMLIAKAIFNLENG